MARTASGQYRRAQRFDRASHDAMARARVSKRLGDTERSKLYIQFARSFAKSARYERNSARFTAHMARFDDRTRYASWRREL